MAADLARKIKALRDERGWSQNELVKQSGVDRGYLASIEINKIANPLTRKSSSNSPVPSTFVLKNCIRLLAVLRVPTESYQRKETPEDILECLRLAQPISIPVYTEYSFLLQLSIFTSLSLIAS